MTFCHFWRFVFRRFVTFDILSFDVMSFDVLYMYPIFSPYFSAIFKFELDSLVYAKHCVRIHDSPVSHLPGSPTVRMGKVLQFETPLSFGRFFPNIKNFPLPERQLFKNSLTTRRQSQIRKIIKWKLFYYTFHYNRIYTV